MTTSVPQVVFQTGVEVNVKDPILLIGNPS